MKGECTGRNPLSRAECEAMRGLAIAGIFLHNYCHWLGPVVKENEYRFFLRNVNGLNDAIINADALLPLHLLSFFGHYGVPVFLFLSAYGLHRKYESDGMAAGSHDTLSFVGNHFLKLFKMMATGFVAFTMVDAVTPGHHRYAVLDIIAQLGMFNNILPAPDKIIWPGPYWFFGLMLQLYLVYRLLLYRRHWSFVVALMVFCWIIQVFCEPEGNVLNRIRYNFMGGMLPFGLGLLYARFGRELSTAAYRIVLPISLAMVYILSLSYQTWFWVPAFAITLCISLVKTLPHAANAFLVWIGGISAALFVCHPITRKIFIPVSRHGDFYAGLLLYIMASIAIAWLFRELMKHVPFPRNS